MNGVRQEERGLSSRTAVPSASLYSGTGDTRNDAAGAVHLPDAVVAGIVDPEAVNACELAGVGRHIETSIGGKGDTLFGKPFKISGTVRSVVSEDSLISYFGKQAIVDLPGVQLIVISKVRSSWMCRLVNVPEKSSLSCRMCAKAMVINVSSTISVQRFYAATRLV